MRFFLLLFLYFLGSPFYAQENTSPKTFFNKCIDFFMQTDTQYVRPNNYNFSFYLQQSIYAEHLYFKGKNEESPYSQTFTSYPLSANIGWKFFFLGYTFNLYPQDHQKAYTNYYLSLYSLPLGIDLFYKNTKIKKHTEPFLYTYWGGNLFYVFNHKRYSLPASFSQSTEQVKNAGSWILNFSFMQKKIGASNNYIYQNYGLSGGYAYAWVLKNHLYANISLNPGFSLVQEGKNGKSFSQSFCLNTNFRIGLVYNTGKYFAGTSFIGFQEYFRNSDFRLFHSFNIFNLYAGFNF